MPLLIAALQEVSLWRVDPRSAPDDAVYELLASYQGRGQVADLLWADLPPATSVEDVADLLNLWSWRTDDNGAQIMRTAERWIDECVNSKKVGVAISLEAFPFVDDRVRLARMMLVGERFPEHRHRCEYIIAETKTMKDRTR